MTRKTAAIIICAPTGLNLGFRMNQLLDFLPIALFAAVFFAMDAPDNIFWATGALMAGVTLQMLAFRVLGKPITGQLKFTFWASILLGGATLLLRDALFIQWKPTIVNWALSAALLLAPLIANVNLLQKMLGGQMRLPDAVWKRLNYGWALGFFIAGALNLLVAYNFSMDFWVSYKLIGGFAITLIYIVITVLYLHRLGVLEEPDKPQEQSRAEDRA